MMDESFFAEIERNLEAIQPEQDAQPLQGTEEWFEARRGKLTASRFSDMMKQGRRKDERFGQACLTYVYEKIGEILTCSVHQVTSQAMEWGTDHEEVAIEHYERIKGVQVKPCGFIEINDIAGGSPDGLVGEDGIIEVKNPFNPANHAKVLITEEVPEAHYMQIQGNLLATGRKWCDYISHDARVQDENLRTVIIRVERDENVIEEIKERIEEVRTKMDEILGQLLNKES